MSQGSLRLAVKTLLAAGCGAALAVATASSASAHAALVGTDPEDGSTLDTAPASVSATFSELLDGPSTEIAVTDPAGQVLEVDEPTFDGDTFTQPMLYTAPGEYTVAFRVISEDGHRVDDSLVFTVESVPDELLAEGAGPQDPTAEAPATTGAEEAPTETAAEEDESNTGAALAMILLAALVVVVGGVLLVKLLGRKTPTDS
ncbi:copper resistance protein CopC [Glycomyces sp. L485]|uniref:copper resistance CopC family protein n=1 Tax=Glycomyces sp. L485 TaxID=2909235 RepID=UPI001F4A70C6|nr:copper resistance CopC family protein [Glycomyces sp. L485]MCH7229386.1 copper resistance protein CopC [Glycomyces sp. L485]